MKAPSVYIAAPLPLRARALELAGWLREAGVFVSSTWHASERATVAVEAALSEQDQDEIAEQCLREIARSTHVALLCGPPTDRHGNVAEAAYAAGLGLPVLACVLSDGVLPTLVLRPLVTVVRDEAELLAVIAGVGGGS